jgi:hypothetical protein
MAQALASYTHNDWVYEVMDSTQGPAAFNETMTALSTEGSPVVVPIWGQADHWVTVWKINTLSTGVKQVYTFDGGNPDSFDSGGTAYMRGQVVYGGAAWLSTYYVVINAINPSCDPTGCVSDPYFHKYVLIWEPPPGAHPPIPTTYLRSPGVRDPGTMTAQLARELVFPALAAAGLDDDHELWSALRRGAPGEAWLVHGKLPTGAAWDYYLVPIYSIRQQAIGFVQLAAADGAFEALQLLPAPRPFAPLDESQAQQRARARLAGGEQLTAGELRWDPRGTGALAHSPSRPYYEYGVVANGTPVATVRVALDDGGGVRE